MLKALPVSEARLQEELALHMILGSAPIEGRFSGVVDIPNSCATVYIPRRIFDFDIAPGTAPHQVKSGVGMGDRAGRVGGVEQPRPHSLGRQPVDDDSEPGQLAGRLYCRQMTPI